MMNGGEPTRLPNAIFKYDAAVKVLRDLRDAGFQAYFAGGCVRDLLLRRRPQDYDIVTDARPEEMKGIFEKTIPVGEKFGVMKVVVSGAEFEVATFRTDEGYADGRRPRAVKFSKSWEDARRRDFTINGMFYDPVSGDVQDYVEGRKDLAARLVRAIGDPEVRFSEDYLRMLRAVRFAASLSFEIDRRTWDAIRSNAEKIKDISGERIRQELELMLLSDRPRASLELLDHAGLLRHILPEVAALKGVRQGRLLHPEGDVWRHTLLSLEHAGEADFPMAMAVLLHDVGKPVTAGASGERPFLNHERVGEVIARKIGRRLRLSKRETEIIAFLVRHHMILKDVREMRKSTLKRVLGHGLFPQLAELHRIDALASNGDLSDYEFAMTAVEELSREEVKPAPLVDGNDLKAIGIEPGPGMGLILERLYTAQLEEEVCSREEALALARKLAAEDLKE
jgi:poly(A) polymerase